jgi:hypothetical protein
MDPTDLTIEILKDIRDATRATSDRVDLVVEWMDRVERRQTETEVRLTTELVAVAGAVREVRDLLREDRGLRDRVDDHERRLTSVEQRAG